MTTAPWSGPRGLRSRPASPRRVSAPRRPAARTSPVRLPAVAPAEWGRAAGAAATAGATRARGFVTTCSRHVFAVLLVGLVLMAMALSLVFNTARGEGAFTLAEVQSAQREAQETRLSLEAQVDQMRSPEQVSARAESLGMVPAGTMGYVDPSSGTVIGEAEAAPAAPATPAPGAADEKRASDGAAAQDDGAPADEKKDDATAPTADTKQKAEKKQKSTPQKKDAAKADKGTASDAPKAAAPSARD